MGHPPRQGQMATQAATYLGFVIDSLRMEFYLPEMKILKIKEKILELLSGSSWVHFREVASAVEIIEAGSRALGTQVVRVCTRALYKDVDRRFKLSDKAKAKLLFRQDNLDSFNSLNPSLLKRTQVPVMVNYLLARDTSGVSRFLGNFCILDSSQLLPLEEVPDPCPCQLSVGWECLQDRWISWQLLYE